MAILPAALTDERLWSLIREGDGEAFGVLYDRHRHRIFAHSLRLVGSSAEAEDVTAMVFLETWRLRARVRVTEGAVIGWLMITANNIARNHLRARWRYQRMLTGLPRETETEDPSELAEAAIHSDQARRALHAGFRLLKARDQDVLTACVLEELSMAEAAILLRIPVGTVKSRLARAKQHLAALVEADDSPAGITRGTP